MNIRKKMDHFRSTVLSECEQQNQEELAKLSEVIQKTKEEEKQKIDLQAEYSQKDLRENMKLKMNRTSSHEVLKLKHGFSEKNVRFEEKIFKEVKEKLEKFKTTEAYTEQLVKYIKESLAVAKGAEVRIYLDLDDADKKEELEKACGISLLVSTYSFGGGVRAVIPSRKILIDNSFESKINEVRRDFDLEREALS